MPIEKGSAEDETISNAALITLLQQLSFLVKDSGYHIEWTPYESHLSPLSPIHQRPLSTRRRPMVRSDMLQ
jgi:hypothetical protein